MTNTFDKHLAAIRHTVTKSNIIGIRKALNAFERSHRYRSTSCTSPQWSFVRVQACLSAVVRYQPVISGEWHASGVKTLQSALKRYKGRFNAAHVRIIGDIWHFRLVDWQCDDSLHWYPVIRCVARDGSFFDFINIPWQSGGDGPTLATGPQAARVKPLWHAFIEYRTPSGCIAIYSRNAMTCDSLAECEATLQARLRSEPGRKVASIVPGSFRASFVTMQIGSNHIDTVET